ncbi:hypothetical protein PMEGAS67_02460 [Priestia megaterium]
MAAAAAVLAEVEAAVLEGVERAEAGKKIRVKRGWDKIRLVEGRSERDGFLIENPSRSVFLFVW